MSIFGNMVDPDGSINGRYPTTAYGYDGKVYPGRPSPGEWRAFRLDQARKLGTHSASEWAQKLAQIGMCAACGAVDRPLAKDHIIPIARGGCDCIHNLQPLCKPCNSSKGCS
jgi:hypothetical protein